MGISYFEEERCFQLDTPNTTYVIGILGKEGLIGHTYYGKRIRDGRDTLEAFRTREYPFNPDDNARDRLGFLDTFPTEYAGHGLGDYRSSSIRVRDRNGHSAVQPCYVSHTIFDGKKKLAGLPATFGEAAEVQTLELICRDNVIGLEIILSYSVFADTDVIARSVRVVNIGEAPIFLTKVMSASLDMDNKEFDLLTLHGSWARERQMQRMPLGNGSHGVYSLRGESGHQEHPFLGLVSHNADEQSGEAYGFHFVYSGNFIAMAQRNQFNSVRVQIGIHPDDFCWKLEPSEDFQAPEAILCYSANGIGQMTRSYHTLYRKHLIRSPYRNRKRPILINNWEGTYFNFDEEKLYAIAEESAKLGIEMLVMDDGWFGKRDDDNSSLGDWVVNEAKLKGGLAALVDRVNALGMEFGVWFEPEMVSPDSDLYRTHPDWAIALPGRVPARSRNQFVLDISRKEVRECIVGQMKKILHDANISYVKWDMNRSLSDLGSVGLAPDRQGELYHRYVLGMYEMQESLITEFPNLLLENCSSGGARFDPGMLYYGPQIWCSDDTDAVERLGIHESTALIYPLSAMGAHVSVCPNHAIGRNTPFATRGYVALTGTFGYELDVTKLSDEDKAMIPKQVAMYHAFN
ncbi:MAG: alpha-galactosidase, partial [Lachnospiraceae bacterium]|nr:alpha-galactosidase [Lachnospiraceae bacterium]